MAIYNVYSTSMLRGTIQLQWRWATPVSHAFGPRHTKHSCVHGKSTASNLVTAVLGDTLTELIIPTTSPLQGNLDTQASDSKQQQTTADPLYSRSFVQQILCTANPLYSKSFVQQSLNTMMSTSFPSGKGPSVTESLSRPVRTLQRCPPPS